MCLLVNAELKSLMRRVGEQSKEPRRLMSKGMKAPPARKYGTEITPSLIEKYSHRRADPGVDFNCGVPGSVSMAFCDILNGKNDDVSTKIQKMISATQIQDESLPTISKLESDEGGNSLTLRNSLWTLYFCAKQVAPACDPQTSADPEVQGARIAGMEALTAMDALDASKKSEQKIAWMNTLEQLGLPKDTTASLAELNMNADLHAAPTDPHVDRSGLQASKQASKRPLSRRSTRKKAPVKALTRKYETKDEGLS